MQIRSATNADIPAITQLKDVVDDSRYIQRILETKGGKAAYLLVEHNDQIIGQVFLKYYGTSHHPTYPNMEDLFVHLQFRSQGVGTMLISACERLAKERGYAQIGLSVNPTLNEKAKSLYEKLGYVSFGEEPYLDAVYNGVEDWVIDLVKTI